VIVTDGGQRARIPDSDAEFTDVARRLGLGIETVVITGHVNTKDRDIYGALELDRNRLLINFDHEAARARVEELPWIDLAAIARVFPNTIKVAVRERRPYAVWRNGGGAYLIDRTGRTLGPVVSVAAGRLPVVAGDGAARRAKEIVSLMDAAPSLSGRVAQAQLVGGRRWTLSLASGSRLHLPALDAAPAFEKFMARPDAGKLLASAQEIDLRGRRGLVVRMASQGNGMELN
jgi:cell division protein FtsQ